MPKFHITTRVVTTFVYEMKAKNANEVYNYVINNDVSDLKLIREYEDNEELIGSRAVVQVEDI